MVRLNQDWDGLLKEEFCKPYYLNLRAYLKKEYATFTIYPKMDDVFNALRYCSYEDTRVVLLGQDPYHGVGQAQGFAFSVNTGTAIPPSLKNVFKEMHNDLGLNPPKNGCLISWVKQGVLLLNTALTVREGQANSHHGKGWEQLTDHIISTLNQRQEPIVFLLWGNNAKTKAALITNKQHYVLSAPHPSPLSASRGFFGCKHFSKTNEILVQLGTEPIDWQL